MLQRFQDVTISGKMISRLNSQFFVNMGDFKEKLGIPFYHRSPHLENTGCSPAQLSDGMRAVAMTAGCWLWACRMTSLNQHHLEACHRLAQLKPNVCSTALPIAALTAAALKLNLRATTLYAGSWLWTWCRGQEQPLIYFVETSNFDSSGEVPRHWFAYCCTKACHIWDTMVVQSLRMPQFSLVAKMQPGLRQVLSTIISLFNSH